MSYYYRHGRAQWKPAPKSLQGNHRKSFGSSILHKIRSFLVILGLIMASNAFTYFFLHPESPSNTSNLASAFGPRLRSSSLYLIDEADKHIYEIEAFEQKVRLIAGKLQVEPEWLMAVMYAESRFDSSIKNHRGSGAVGLIQFMPATLAELGATVNQMEQISPVEQLDFVYRYLHQVQRRYGAFESLTDLYLAILYPRALQQDYCYTLYAKPSKAYRQNSGLDENKDGVVTVSDIDKRLKRLHMEAYVAGNGPDREFWAKLRLP